MERAEGPVWCVVVRPLPDFGLMGAAAGPVALPELLEVVAERRVLLLERSDRGAFVGALTLSSSPFEYNILSPMLTSSTIKRFVARSTFWTMPDWPRCLPLTTTTLSPRNIFQRLICGGCLLFLGRAQG